ncbi:MAG: Fur family transcriptional regulator [Candidatus Dormibacteria bacterium]
MTPDSKAAGAPEAKLTGAADVRSTRQKRALSAVLEETDRFRSAQELHGSLRQRGERVGLTTVYQQLRALAAAGQIDSLRSDSGELLYRHCGTPRHHHHLVCRICGRTVEVEDTVVWRWAERVAAEAGFVDVAHHLEFSGTCAVCARAGG